MQERKIETKRGIKCRVLEAGQGAPLVFFHGAGGLLEEEPLLEALVATLPRVRAGVAGLRRGRAARRSSRTCSTSRCTAGTWSRRSASTRARA